tara:strand:- start:4 stop:249 length:246 start_codon:yes stop_codon:yes gene_type:complete
MSSKEDFENTFPKCKQEGGSHYKNKKIQPFKYCRTNGFNTTQSNIVKYATRLYDHKDGPEIQLKKIIHYCELELEFLKNEK